MSRRIDALRRARAEPPGEVGAAAGAVVCGRRLVRRPAPAPVPLPAPAPVPLPIPGPGQAPVPLAEAVPGEAVDAPGGRPGSAGAWLVRGRAPLPEGGLEGALDGILFFDIEACGLTAAPLFLIGVMCARNGSLETRQYLARDYSEEGTAIRLFAREAAAASHLVSFNGKSYDLPYMRNRAGLSGAPLEVDLPHTDLLHASRRRFALVLPNCRLGTLERRVLDVHRTDDIPGSEIPAAYHEFVRTGDARIMARIVEHNRIDLVSMASLLALLFPSPRNCVPTGGPA